jgi:hypothetical protein
MSVSRADEPGLPASYRLGACLSRFFGGPVYRLGRNLDVLGSLSSGLTGAASTGDEKRLIAERAAS